MENHGEGSTIRCKHGRSGNEAPRGNPCKDATYIGLRMKRYTSGSFNVDGEMSQSSRGIQTRRFESTIWSRITTTSFIAWMCPPMADTAGRKGKWR